MHAFMGLGFPALILVWIWRMQSVAKLAESEGRTDPYQRARGWWPLAPWLFAAPVVVWAPDPVVRLGAAVLGLAIAGIASLWGLDRLEAEGYGASCVARIRQVELIGFGVGTWALTLLFWMSNGFAF